MFGGSACLQVKRESLGFSIGILATGVFLLVNWACMLLKGPITLGGDEPCPVLGSHLYLQLFQTLAYITLRIHTLP